MLKGIDVSFYQGDIDWERVKPQIDFAILRIGLGDDIPSQDDKQFERNYAECIRLGIPFAVYFFSYAVNKAKVQSEIAHIKRLLNGKAINAPVYIDVENTRGLDWRTISNAELLGIMQEFNAQLNALGYKMGIYSSRSAFWNEKMTDKWYDSISKWVAEYGDKVNDFNRTYDIWQYTSKGRIDGIAGNVDMNNMYNNIFTEDKLQPAPKPQPTPAPKTATTDMQEYSVKKLTAYELKWGNIMKKIFTKQWFKAAGVRALKTVCQTAVATIGTSAVISSVDWKVVISASVLAGILSILNSFAGLPEVKGE